MARIFTNKESEIVRIEEENRRFVWRRLSLVGTFWTFVPIRVIRGSQTERIETAKARRRGKSAEWSVGRGPRARAEATPRHNPLPLPSRLGVLAVQHESLGTAKARRTRRRWIDEWRLL